MASAPVLSTTGMEPAKPLPRSIDPNGVSIARELNHIDDRIDDARSARTLSRRDARGFRRQNGLIGDLAERYARDGLSANEVREIEFRTGVLNEQVSSRMHGGNLAGPED